LAPKGTAFQKAVWQALLSIPHGELRSYQEIAQAIGRPQSVRAVANAIGANPICVLIPCHRVIRSDGSIGGYSSGLAIKRQLLVREGHTQFAEPV
jgi:O-6-methylguanine DNA methyltransferase